MYVKRIQLLNYGPIDHIDLELPFDDERPKPVLLIGENGSGKSILLSHIVNGLISAKDRTYPNSPEVEKGRVYKLRSSFYIKLDKEVYFARVDFEDDLFLGEIRSRSNKAENQELPAELKGDHIADAWHGMPVGNNDHTVSTIRPNNIQKITALFSKNSVLYFPPNRFEEPAWLNEENLTSRAEYMGLKNMVGHTERRIINYAPLRNNQNWLFEVVYDRAVFETRTASINFGGQDGPPIPLPVFVGYSGEASSSYEAAIEVIRNALPKIQNVRFGIGRRRDRAVSIMAGDELAVPNIFQMSTGETSLLNLFLSILRDYELSGATFNSIEDIRGVVVVDEIDLHLHVSHQYSILPNLMKLFPRVQFIVTTHSPLFILGIRNVFGDGGFALYRMPGGDEIDPEDFSEFESAYQAFASTDKFISDLQSAVVQANKPIVLVEGTIDLDYVKKAAELLGNHQTLGKIELREAGGAGNLKKLWNAPVMYKALPFKVGLFYDCDEEKGLEVKGSFTRQSIPYFADHPIKKGIENLLSEQTLSAARENNPDFFVVEEAHNIAKGGSTILIPAKWAVNEGQKRPLCDWLCKNGTAEDFKSFEVVFEMLEALLDASEATTDELE